MQVVYGFKQGSDDKSKIWKLSALLFWCFPLFPFICLIVFTLCMPTGKDSREDDQRPEQALVLHYTFQIKLLGNMSIYCHLQLERSEHRIKNLYSLQKYYIRPQSYVLTAETPNSPFISLFSTLREGCSRDLFTRWGKLSDSIVSLNYLIPVIEPADHQRSLCI